VSVLVIDWTTTGASPPTMTPPTHTPTVRWRESGRSRKGWSGVKVVPACDAVIYRFSPF
jgi:hypothetical protein